jgi:hypothetical protein
VLLEAVRRSSQYIATITFNFIIKTTNSFIIF